MGLRGTGTIRSGLIDLKTPTIAMREIRKRTEPRMMNHMRAVSFILKFSGLTYLASYIEMDYVSWLNLVYRLLKAG